MSTGNKSNNTIDELKQKMIERLGDILDAIKVEADTIVECSNSHDEDNDVSNTIWNLADAF
ncbi:MAG: hypothetical protein J6Y02_24900, partial [Pseudobutyrivibrio sp.]|nr:hypothetical protein [Pseudobutyrivibrio sp.]